MKEIKGVVQQTGKFLLVSRCLSSNLFAVGIGRMMNAMIDDKLGAFELHSSIKLIIICSIHTSERYSHVAGCT